MKQELGLSNDQIKILKNAYGFDSKKPGFRTHYCGRLSNEDIQHLVKQGFLTEPQVDGTCGEGLGMYYLTPEAIVYLKQIKASTKNKESIHN